MEKPLPPLHHSLAFIVPAKHIRFACCGQCSTTNPQTKRFGDFFNGVVVFEAKTDELEQHYIRDFGAHPVASLYPDGPKTFMIADQAAKDIFSSYLF